jgi:hypothetical protein
LRPAARNFLGDCRSLSPERLAVAERRRHPLRLTAFWWGVLAGVFAPLAVVGAVSGTGRLWAPAPKFNLVVASAGADVSRHGGVEVLTKGDGAPVSERCNGACDDVEVSLHINRLQGEVRVVDGLGQCLACSTDAYIDSGYGTSAVRQTISGAETLTIRPDGG